MSLRVLGKRPDGYHEISTTLQTISLHDDLLFERNVSGEISLSCDDPEIPLGADNLVVQAARSLKDYCAADSGVDIRLHSGRREKIGRWRGWAEAANPTGQHKRPSISLSFFSQNDRKLHCFTNFK